MLSLTSIVLIVYIRGTERVNVGLGGELMLVWRETIRDYTVFAGGIHKFVDDIIRLTMFVSCFLQNVASFDLNDQTYPP